MRGLEKKGSGREKNRKERGRKWGEGVVVCCPTMGEYFF